MDERPEATNPSPNRPPLRRLRRGRLLAGVCAGVARRYDLPVALVRVVWFVVAAIPVLPGLPMYLICWLMVPWDLSQDQVTS